MGNDLTSAAVASGQFWKDPAVKKIGKVNHLHIQYEVGNLYRGSKSIITEDELRACKVILRAYRKYRIKRSNSYAIRQYLDVKDLYRHRRNSSASN
ncbi:hypothetical protein SteCoe_31184 [Stentor coeruleus]|uniref:Uncharacterized protein n=1 Tax=Stentor coeruleus TaxID=5963 RepID=A0A1R2B1U8_9CILI|nr:hypothetical protein SteCoe_31184 [Stentor coeruleus]